MPSVKPGDTIAVTGANGLVASHCIKVLLAKGFDVAACVRDPTNETKVAHLKAMAEGAAGSIVFYKSSLDVDGSYDEAFEGAQGIIHTAAVVHDHWSLSLLDSHIQGTTRVVESAKKSSTLKRFIQTSSIAAIIDPFVHEKDPEHVFTEKDFNQTEDPSVTGDFYGYAKRVAEKIAVEAGADENTGFDAVVINPGVVIGESLCKAHTKASPVFIRQVVYGNEQPEIYFSWCDAEDVANAHLEALTREDASKSPGRYIIADDFHGSVVDVLPLLEKIFPTYAMAAVTTPWWKRAAQYFFMNKYQYAMLSSRMKVDGSLATERLGINYVGIEESLRRTVESMVENGYIKPKVK
jgi:nucleoside-diphosphate-sugar epimerase|eukprot:g1153.t1